MHMFIFDLIMIHENVITGPFGETTDFTLVTYAEYLNFMYTNSVNQIAKSEVHKQIFQKMKIDWIHLD